MTPANFAPFAILIAIAFFMLGRRYEVWKRARDNDAAERIRRKYQAHKGSTERV